MLHTDCQKANRHDSSEWISIHVIDPLDAMTQCMFEPIISLSLDPMEVNLLDPSQS